MKRHLQDSRLITWIGTAHAVEPLDA